MFLQLRLKKLGMTGQTKVQVQVLADQSTAVKNATLGSSTPQEAPAAQPVMGGNGAYTVQVAAFYSEDNAKNVGPTYYQYG